MHIAAPVCWLRSHSWSQYGPPPMHADYLPPVERCGRCGRFRLADGSRLSIDLRRSIRPYPPSHHGPTGWTDFHPRGDQID